MLSNIGSVYCSVNVKLIEASTSGGCVYLCEEVVARCLPVTVGVCDVGCVGVEGGRLPYLF